MVLRTAGNQTITAEDMANGLMGNALVMVLAQGKKAAPATQLSLTSPFAFLPNVGFINTFITAGSPFTITVTALDKDGKVATGYRGTVHFISDDPFAKLPADYTFLAKDQGTHTFSNVVLQTVGLRRIIAIDVGNALTATASFSVRAATIKGQISGEFIQSVKTGTKIDVSKNNQPTYDVKKLGKDINFGMDYTIVDPVIDPNKLYQVTARVDVFRLPPKKGAEEFDLITQAVNSAFVEAGQMFKRPLMPAVRDLLKAEPNHQYQIRYVLLALPAQKIDMGAKPLNIATPGVINLGVLQIVLTTK